MKNTKIKVMAVTMASAVLLQACTQVIDAIIVTTEEAAQSAAYAIALNPNGMMAQVEDAIALADAEGICAFESDSTIHRVDVDTNDVDFDYVLDYNFNRTCNGDMPQKFSLTAAGSGFYDAPKMKADDAVTLDMSLSGLSEGADYRWLNSTFRRQGAIKSKLFSFIDFENDLTLTLSNIKISKATGFAETGIGNLKISTKTAGNHKYYFNGTIGFLPGRKAVIKIKDETFLVDLVSGEIIR